MLNIFLIRHGETDWNVLRRLQGHSDIPLNQTGIDQALSIQSELKKINPCKIFSSDLIRAIETAKLSTQNGAMFNKQIISSSELREVYLGQAEGLTHIEVEQQFGAHLWTDWSKNNSDLFHIRFPGGESKAEALHRFENYIRSQCQASLEQKQNETDTDSADEKPNNLVFYSHGLVIRSFIHKHTPNLANSFIVKNVQIISLIYSNSKFLLQSDTTTNS